MIPKRAYFKDSNLINDTCVEKLLNKVIEFKNKSIQLINFDLQTQP